MVENKKKEYPPTIWLTNGTSEGEYVLEVNKMASYKEAFVAEFTVKASSNEDIKPGDIVTYRETFPFDGQESKFTNKVEYPGRETRNKLIAAAGGPNYKPQDVTDEVVEHVTGKENPMMGKKVKCSAKLRKNGKYCYLIFAAK